MIQAHLVLVEQVRELALRSAAWKALGGMLHKTVVLCL